MSIENLLNIQDLINVDDVSLDIEEDYSEEYMSVKQYKRSIPKLEILLIATQILEATIKLAKSEYVTSKKSFKFIQEDFVKNAKSFYENVFIANKCKTDENENILERLKYIHDAYISLCLFESNLNFNIKYFDKNNIKIEYEKMFVLVDKCYKILKGFENHTKEKLIKEKEI